MKPISGFSRLSKNQKIDFLTQQCFANSEHNTTEIIKSFWHTDSGKQKVFDDFSENTVTNFFFPYGVVPNVLIDDILYCVPMVTEESSVVAAASKSAKYWLSRGGFHTEIVATTKVGQVHFGWTADSEILTDYFNSNKTILLEEVAPLIANMEKRGGGIKDIQLLDKTDVEPDYYQLYVELETCDSMGANLINSVLEALANKLKTDLGESCQIIMAILSNYTPDCLVKTYVECPIDQLACEDSEMSGMQFAEKFEKAVKISKLDVSRATTHNKGIFNGIDAVVLATGNDFRAVEACGHTYAARDGVYRGLSDVTITGDTFRFSLEIPLALGTVGGLTSLHPMAKLSLDMLDNPSAQELMKIVATIGLAQNFAAVRSLITLGIQKGHMKMHLMNILNHLEASESERCETKKYFFDKAVSYAGVREYLSGLRGRTQ